MNIKTSLTVYFDDPFWVGVFEIVDDGILSVSKITFGQEPKNHEILEYILRYYGKLKFSKNDFVKTKPLASSPKRRQKDASKKLKEVGIGTKSQQALKKIHDEMIIERKQKKREQKEDLKKRIFELKQEKRKEKRKGH